MPDPRVHVQESSTIGPSYPCSSCGAQILQGCTHYCSTAAPFQPATTTVPAFKMAARTVGMHVDLYRLNHMLGTRTFVSRLELDDPKLVKADGWPTQLAEGGATYHDISEPHTMEDCPHDER